MFANIHGVMVLSDPGKTLKPNTKHDDIRCQLKMFMTGELFTASKMGDCDGR